ncbi:MAG: hypothetical protein HQL05_04275 [Nitrospirae bacterium]|uniref:hypothetical protein n=1 Tax=Candidatus Magnetobacterium casense TaxID=1455061 RepID=UPI0005900C6D|nr:hypothetical protein [Candidatus Magnetobacterium casensis]MBF0337027.1 hypothetical protein [Nitrospirota bacterium]
MKRSIVYLMLLLVALFGVSMWSGNVSTVTAADTVTYTLPYLHTAAANVVYCVVSNNTSDNATVGVYLTAYANKLTAISGDKINTSTTANKTIQAFQTSMLTFGGSTNSGTDIYLTISDGTNSSNNVIGSISGVSGSYGAYLVITKATANTTDGASGSLNCENTPMACFQGTSTPKRNLVGYSCQQSNTGAKGGTTAIYTY